MYVCMYACMHVMYACIYVMHVMHVMHVRNVVNNDQSVSGDKCRMVPTYSGDNDDNDDHNNDDNKTVLG